MDKIFSSSPLYWSCYGTPSNKNSVVTPINIAYIYAEENHVIDGASYIYFWMWYNICVRYLGVMMTYPIKIFGDKSGLN